RAGVSLAGIRTWAFALCSATAGLGGILLGAFFFGQYSTNTADPGQLVLYTVAAAVIGGVSLFGGRGKALHGVLGGLLIGGIAYGVSLLNLGSLSTPLQYILPGAVLLAAVLIDVLSRRGAGSVTRVCSDRGLPRGPGRGEGRHDGGRPHRRRRGRGRRPPGARRPVAGP